MHTQARDSERKSARVREREGGTEGRREKGREKGRKGGVVGWEGREGREKPGGTRTTHMRRNQS